MIEGENFIKLILPRGSKGKNRGAKKDELAQLFAASSEISLSDVQKILGVSRATATRKMNQWIRKGKVERLGKTRSIRFRYCL